MGNQGRISQGIQSGLTRARRHALTVIEPAPNEIQIDIDGARALHVFSRQYMMLERHGLTNGWKQFIRPSFTKGHAHITIALPRARPLAERITLAALLGSDLKRECFNYVRARTRRRVPVAFFEKRV